MHSKWQIWDFFSSFQRDYLKDFEGRLALSTFDPTCLKLVKDFLTRGASSRVIHYKMASEVTKNWIEEEFQALSLFGNTDCFFIHEAQDLKADIIELLSKTEITDRFVILSFESEGTGWKKITKDGKTTSLTIEPPKFWEQGKLLEFVCQYLRLPLSFDSKNWMLDSIENTLGNFYNSACILKLNFPDVREVQKTDVLSVLTLDRLDQFNLASLLARKKTPEFYEKLLALEQDFDRMRGFFNFLQGHLIKMADPSYLQQKPRLTQYDKDLQGTSKLWKNEDLIGEIEKFNRWEILSKKRSAQLWHEIKEAHLRALTP